MDKEYLILETINNNSEITQRELSKRTGLSLGSINLLLSKMVKDGLIKIRQIPMNRALYMLTPKGMAEKVNKTYSYIKVHYRFINETKEKIKISLLEIIKEENDICLLLENDEISDLILSAFDHITGITCSNNKNKLDFNKTIIVTNNERFDELISKGYKVINLIERL